MHKTGKEGIKQKERLISSEEWNKVTESFDFAVFETLDFSECNICVDGCDEIIQITQQHKTHKISYTPNTKMNEIEELQKILYELTTEMRKMN